MRAALRTSVIVAALAMPGAASSTTRVVGTGPGAAYTTIQSAVNAAVPIQDDVFVTCGRYRENVTMRSGVDVRGSNPHCATLEGLGGATGPAVTFPVLLVPTELSRLTIRAGTTQPAIVGGDGQAIISQNIIEGSKFGIRISSLGGANPVITRDVIRNHTEGGIHVEIFDPAATPVITSNVVVGSGLGISVVTYSDSLLLANNTVVRNPAGGVYAYTLGGSDTIVANNVVAWNAGAGVTFYGFSAPRIVRNDVWSNSPDFDVSTGDPSGVNGSYDPMFVNELPDFVGFMPRTGSALVDAALSDVAPAVDLRGVRRVSGRGCGYGPDIGAKENEGITNLRPWGTTGLLWDSLPAPCFIYGPEHQVLRGDLGVLRSTGVYVQNPAEVPAAMHWCEVFSGAFADNQTPPSGEAFFYLVTGWNDCETPLGFSSTPSLRPGSACWGACPAGPEN